MIGGLETVQTNTERDPADVPNFIVNASVEYTIPDTMTVRMLYPTEHHLRSLMSRQRRDAPARVPRTRNERVPAGVP